MPSRKEPEVILRVSYVMREDEVKLALAILEEAWLQGFLKLKRAGKRKGQEGGAA